MLDARQLMASKGIKVGAEQQAEKKKEESAKVQISDDSFVQIKNKDDDTTEAQVSEQ